jgi:hypothetical protein
MSNVLKVSLHATKKSLADRGWSQGLIARELGINRKTAAGRYSPLGEGAKPAILTPGVERPRKQNRPFRPPAKMLVERVDANRWPK